MFLWCNTNHHPQYQRNRLQSRMRLWQRNDPYLRRRGHHIQRLRLGQRQKLMRFRKPCLDCGALTAGGTRCEIHQKKVEDLAAIRRATVKKATGQYSGSYKKRAEMVRNTAITCWICGEGPRANDPWQADHVNPSEHGNVAELRAAHGSCNRRRSNKV